jgi:tetratricopeptide (TPR) repeat protein
MAADPSSTSPASAVVDAEHPWPGLVSYTEEGAAFFFGREREVAELARLVRQEVLSVLFGKSGLGKSSLLRAGLAPVLHESEFLPVFIRLDYADEAPALEAQVRQRIAETLTAHRIDAEAPAADETLWQYFHRRGVDWWDADNRLLKPVLIFDQFEELLTMGQGGPQQAARTASFLTELEDLVENRVPAEVQKRFEAERGHARQYDLERVAYRVILSLREDFLADLEGLNDRLRQIISNRFRLLPMSGSQAMDVIMKPQAHPVAESVAVEIVHFVSSSERSRLQLALDRSTVANRQVEPALLSVVLRELNSHRIRTDAPAITAELVRGQQATQILDDFFERGLEGMEARVRQFILDQLLTTSGARNRVAEEDALTRYGIAPGTIARLIDRRILQRQLSGTVKWLELTHDTLADVVRRHRDEQAQRRAVAEAAEREKVVRRQLARTRRLVAAFAGLFLLAGVGLAYAVYNQVRLNASNRTLEEQKRDLDESNATLERTSVAMAQKNDELRRRAEEDAATIVEQLRSQLDEWNAGTSAHVIESLARVKAFSRQIDSPTLTRSYVLAGIFGAELLFTYGHIGEGASLAADTLATVNAASTYISAEDPTGALLMGGAHYVVARGASETGRYEEGEAHARDAMRLLAAFRRGDEQGHAAVDTQRMQILAQLVLGYIDVQRGMTQNAKATYESLLGKLGQISDLPGDAGQFLQAQALQARGELASREEDLDGALSSFTKSLDIAREYAGRNSDGLRWTRLRAEIAYRQASAIRDSGRFDELKRLLEEARSAADAVFQADGQDHRSAFIRSRVGLQLAWLYQRSGDIPRAEKALNDALAISTDIVRMEPTWISGRRLDGILHYYKMDIVDGSAQSKAIQGKQPEPSVHDHGQEFTRTLRIYESIARDAPMDAENLRDIAFAAQQIGVHLSERDKDYDGAMRYFSLARRSIERIPTAAKNLPRFQRMLSRNLQLIGIDVHDPQGKRDEARKAYLEAIRIESAVVKLSPTLDSFTTISDNYWNLGNSYLGEGLIERASAAFDQCLAAYDQSLGRFPTDESIASTKSQLAYEVATRWREAGRQDTEIELLTVATETALDALKVQPLQYELYDVLEKVDKRSEELNETIGTPAVAGTDVQLAKEQIAALRVRIANGMRLTRADKSLDAKDNVITMDTQQWPVSPLVPGAWRLLPRDERSRELERLAAGNAFERRVALAAGRIRKLPLTFHDDATLYEVEALQPAGAVYNYVRLPDLLSRVIELNGPVTQLRELFRSQSSLLDTPEQVAQFVHFYFNAINSDGSNFRIFDTIDDLRFLPSASKEQRASIGKSIAPLEIRRNSAGKWDGRATLRLGYDIVSVVFRVDDMDNRIANSSRGQMIASRPPVLWERFEESRRSLVEYDHAQDLADQALRRQLDLAAQVEKVEIERDGKAGLKTASELSNVSWRALFARDFNTAIAAADRAWSLNSDNIIPLGNKAHALMFLGREDEARALYLAYRGKPLAPGDSRLWERAAVDDFAEFRDAGLTHRMMSEIEKELGLSR